MRLTRQPRRASLKQGLTLVCAVVWSCGLGSAVGPAPPASADLALLFIGNSLTYVNDLPGMLEALLEEQGGVGDVHVATVASPNFGLEDHWSIGEARDRIGRGGWDYVIMQQGPSATEGRPSLLDYSARFAAEIVAAGARPALYMVWPQEARSFDFDGVLDSYRTAAVQTGGLFFPAGEAWRAAWARQPNLQLYAIDRFHPSPIGTYTAAVVMYEQLSGRDPMALTGAIPGGPTLTPQAAAAIHAAAAEMNALYALP
jgi:hypothetical protein